MAKLVDLGRRLTRFLLAGFFWSHAFFFFNTQSNLIEWLTQHLHLTATECVLLTLLVIFGFIAGSGFWRTLTNLAYIFAFPLILLFYFFYFPIKSIVVLRRWFGAKATNGFTFPKVKVIQLHDALALSAPITTAEESSIGPKLLSLFRVLGRPFWRFTLLWGLLILWSTHELVTEVALVIFLIHLTVKIYRVVRVSVFSQSWLVKIENGIRETINKTLDQLVVLNFEGAPVQDLKNLLNQIKIFERTSRWIANTPAYSRWLWIICGGLILSIHLYFAFLFSFAYFGIAQVAHAPLLWRNALIDSIFIPIYATDLPNVAAIKIVAGIQFFLVVSVSIGAAFKYFRRWYESLRSTTDVITIRLSAEETRAKYILLQKIVEQPPNPSGENSK
ncbi:MAG TPA: hypothetical protein VKR82_05115 [Candidatus Acidoferrales bacterium]|nr:hypothetical protein [Candidatus Acidoferrales bacterium]